HAGTCSTTFAIAPCGLCLPGTACTALYTLSLHDALPIYPAPVSATPSPTTSRSTPNGSMRSAASSVLTSMAPEADGCASASRRRSEEHTSELQSRENLVCRLLLEKKYKSVALLCRGVPNR